MSQPACLCASDTAADLAQQCAIACALSSPNVTSCGACPLLAGCSCACSSGVSPPCVAVDTKRAGLSSGDVLLARHNVTVGIFGGSISTGLNVVRPAKPAGRPFGELLRRLPHVHAVHNRAMRATGAIMPSLCYDQMMPDVDVLCAASSNPTT